MIDVNSTTSSSSTRRFIFQQLYQLFSFLYKYIQSILSPRPTIKYYTTKDQDKSIALQYYKGKTLVLDLDETLVHSVRLGATDTNHIKHTSIKKKTIEVTSEKQSILYEVYKRPHVDFFLSTVCTIAYCIWFVNTHGILTDKQMVQSSYIYCFNVRICWSCHWLARPRSNGDKSKIFSTGMICIYYFGTHIKLTFF